MHTTSVYFAPKQFWEWILGSFTFKEKALILLIPEKKNYVCNLCSRKFLIIWKCFKGMSQWAFLVFFPASALSPPMLYCSCERPPPCGTSWRLWVAVPAPLMALCAPAKAEKSHFKRYHHTTNDKWNQKGLASAKLCQSTFSHARFLRVRSS